MALRARKAANWQRSFKYDYSFQILTEDGRRLYVNTTNPEKSNWLRYVRPAPSREMRNVVTVHKNNELYFITSRDILKGEEILYWTDDPDMMWSKKRSEKSSKDSIKIKISSTFILAHFFSLWRVQLKV